METSGSSGRRCSDTTRAELIELQMRRWFLFLPAANAEVSQPGSIGMVRRFGLVFRVFVCAAVRYRGRRRCLKAELASDRLQERTLSVNKKLKAVNKVLSFLR